MKTIYVVMVSEGAYEDRSQWLLRGFLTQEKADAAIVAEKLKDERYNSIIGTAADKFREWRQENYCSQLELLKLPHKDGVKQNSEEGRALLAERHRITDENHTRAANNRALMLIWNEKADVESRRIVRQLGATEEEVNRFAHPTWSRSTHDYSYDIEELEVEE